MANNTDSNITRKVIRAFVSEMEAQRVVTKEIDTQTFKGEFTPQRGDNVDIKRPHQYKAKRTNTGDISALTANDIISGKATATVQQYITVDIDWTNKEEATRLDQLKEIVAPAASEAIQELETSFIDYAIQNAGLSYGTPGTVVDAWGDVAGARSLMNAIGVPQSGPINYIMNDFTVENLANTQAGLNSSDKLVNTAWQRAQISTPFAGLQAMTSNGLSTWTSSDASDRAGALDGAPDATYVTHKDSYIQSIDVDGLSANAVVKAGDIIEYSTKYYVNQVTRKPIFGKDGAKVKFRQTVTADATMDGTGAGTLLVTGPAVYDSTGQYRFINAALADGDVFTILGAASTEYQPNLFFCKEAFAMAFVKLPKLNGWDTIATTKDGISMRVTKYSDGDKNTQKVRIDLLPAFGTMNPFFAGKGFGVA